MKRNGLKFKAKMVGTTVIGDFFKFDLPVTAGVLEEGNLVNVQNGVYVIIKRVKQIK